MINKSLVALLILVLSSCQRGADCPVGLVGVPVGNGWLDVSVSFREMMRAAKDQHSLMGRYFIDQDGDKDRWLRTYGRYSSELDVIFAAVDEKNELCYYVEQRPGRTLAIERVKVSKAGTGLYLISER